MGTSIISALKVPIIAGYIAGFFMAGITGIINVGIMSEASGQVLLAILWPITMILSPNIEIFSTIIAAIVVGILTWFALRK